ncbi:carbohydrate-binding domain-containing protein [Dankookia rubra]|nr:carbohydrate-binding domain-containing protein [Dankookia rubra]
MAKLVVSPTVVRMPARTTIGSGPDSLVLRISQDYYQGDANYEVFVDDVQIGGTFTASALHSSAQSDTLIIKNGWAPGSHKVAVKFLNDAWGGTAAADRNLYLEAATYNGAAVPGAPSTLWTAGTVAFSYTKSALAIPASVSLSAGSGSDVLVLKFSQDAYQGSAQYTVKIDGVQVGGTFTASAWHSSDSVDTLTLKGNWALGQHQVSVTFLNDAWGGTAATDRNLYLDSATYNGTALPGVAKALMITGPESFVFTDFAAPSPTPSPTPTPPAGSVVIHVGESIQAKVDAFPPGTTFWLEAGEHRMQTVTPKDGQSFVGAEGAILDGSRLLTGFTQDGDDWVIGNQTQEGQRSNVPIVVGWERAGYPDAVYIDGVPLRPVDTRAEVTPGKFYFDYAANRIYIGENPTGHKVEAAVTPLAFGGAAQNVSLSHITVEQYASPVQNAAVGGINGVKNWSLNDIDIRLNFGTGVKLGEGSKLINSLVSDNGQLGAGGVGAGILVDGTEFARNGGWAGIDPNWEGGGFKFAFTSGAVIRNSYSHDNTGIGMWTDINNVKTLYEGNTIVNNSWGGLQHEISYDAVIRNNVIVGNGAAQDNWVLGAGIQLSNVQGVEVYGNVVDSRGGGAGIIMWNADRTADATRYNAPLSYTTINNNVHDNRVIGPGENGMVATYDGSVLWSGNNHFDGNEYHVPSLLAPLFYYGDGQYTFEQLRAITAWEAKGSAVLL